MDDTINPLDIYSGYEDKISHGLDHFKTMLRTAADYQLQKLSEARQNVGELPGQIADAASSTADTFGKFLKGKAPVTQAYGNYNPGVEKFSGGVNYGTDLGTPEGTQVNLPKGNWTVLKSFSGARGGYLGDNENSGYGNSVLVQNKDTGEKLRFSHLKDVYVKPGQQLAGGIFGTTGGTGNVTGPHLDLEYYNALGQIADVLSSKYGRYLQ